MTLLFKIAMPLSATTDCLVLPVWEKKLLLSHAKTIDTALDGALTAFLKKSTSLENVSDVSFFSPMSKRVKATQILLVNLGKPDGLTGASFKKTMEKVAGYLESQHYKSVSFSIDDVLLKDADINHTIRFIAIALQHATYRFEHYKSAPKTSALREIMIVTTTLNKNLEEGIKQASAIVQGMTTMMDLANCPPNICQPNYLAEQAKLFSKAYKTITVKILDEKALKKIGAGAILAVGQGSQQKSKLIILEYTGTTKTKAPHVLVGKGITFDTGGNNLKSFEGMLGMKYDMSGAASVFGAVKAAAELKLKINLIGVIAAAENMPGTDAYRPEDVITSLSGQTIEVLNTDAEGRLVLCDALTYVERYKPQSVIDIATLTGAIITCLGDVNSGLFSNDETLAEKIQQAAKTSQDGVWRLPIGEAYDAMINSSIADMRNIGGAAAGSTTAACFLARFTKKYAWAHLDIAGTASIKAGLNRSSTGRPIPLLVEYLLQL